MAGLRTGGRRRTRRRAVAGALAVAVLMGTAVLVGVQRSERGESAHGPILRSVAPAFTAPLASRQGRTLSLGGERGHPVLLSFLSTQAEATAANDPSRAEVVLLKSMNTQHHRYGLRTIIVDAARAAGASAPSRSALINFTFDWALDPSIAVVGDPEGSIERAYEVTTVPTTFLIDARGVIRRRWDGFALAAQLDFAIRPLVGRAIPGAP